MAAPLPSLFPQIRTPFSPPPTPVGGRMWSSGPQPAAACALPAQPGEGRGGVGRGALCFCQISYGFWVELFLSF